MYYPPGLAPCLPCSRGPTLREVLWTLAIILATLWSLGIASGAPLGPWLHLLLAAAAVSATFALLLAAARARVPGARTGRAR